MIVVSIVRLVTLARAGSHLLDDLTWTTIGYMEWVQCEGPISLVSVCLPNIFRLFKRVHQKGVRGSFPDSRGGLKVPSSTSGQHRRQFVRMEDYPSHPSAQQRVDSEGTHENQGQGDNHTPELAV